MGFSKSRSEIVLRAHRLAHWWPRRESGLGRQLIGKRTAVWTIVVLTCLLSQLWIPVDSMSSSRSKWSPWPSWSAQASHFFGFNLRDYEKFDRRVQVYELRYDDPI
jgi:hypothetical protein